MDFHPEFQKTVSDPVFYFVIETEVHPIKSFHYKDISETTLIVTDLLLVVSD